MDMDMYMDMYMCMDMHCEHIRHAPFEGESYTISYL